MVPDSKMQQDLRGFRSDLQWVPNDKICLWIGNSIDYYMHMCLQSIYLSFLFVNEWEWNKYSDSSNIGATFIYLYFKVCSYYNCIIGNGSY